MKTSCAVATAKVGFTPATYGDAQSAEFDAAEASYWDRASAV
ncbi:MAG: hypothetical protein VXZ82_01420 [Planctomycetota bacterium]|nr:hypothetical protein [Planctomycetota bacterium]